MRLATSYPYLLNQYLKENDIKAQVLELAGSVEIAPKLGMADAICDLVSTGRTLEENNLNLLVQVLPRKRFLRGTLYIVRSIYVERSGIFLET